MRRRNSFVSKGVNLTAFGAPQKASKIEIAQACRSEKNQA
jgi:hypothetical protein